MSGEHLDRHEWKSYVDSNGDLMVSIGDVLQWLRNCETAWEPCRDDSPQRVAAHLGDVVRDLWLEAMRNEADR